MSCSSTVSEYKIINMDAGDASSDWIQINGTLNGGMEKGYTMAMNASDSIVIELSNSRDPNTLVTSSMASDAITGSTQAGGTIVGAFKWLRLVKTGSNGAVAFEIQV
jgi:hypothetical protein